MCIHSMKLPSIIQYTCVYVIYTFKLHLYKNKSLQTECENPIEVIFLESLQSTMANN